jgi:flagellin
MYGRLTQNKLDTSLERLNSGFRINRAADDSSGMIIADQLRSQSHGLIQGTKNAHDAIGMVKIADSALIEYQDLLVQARDKASAAISDTNSDEARNALEEDVKQLMEQANSIATQTSFNGINLLDGSFSNKSIQVGAYAGQTISITIGDTKTATLGIADGDIDLTTGAGATTAVTDIDTAIAAIDTIRAGIGSTQNALESRVRTNEATTTNILAAESQIRDTDMAAETANANKLQIQTQVQSWALGKTFDAQSSILNLLR